VISHIEKENEYTDAVMEPFKSLQDQVCKELIGRVIEEDRCYPYKYGEYFYYWRTEKGKGYRIYCRSKSIGVKEEILLNENEMAEGKDFFKVGILSVSPNGKTLAFSTDEVGSERYNLQFKNLQTGELLEEVVKDTEDFAWVDNNTYVYTKQNASWRPYCVKLRSLSNPGNARMLFEEKDEKH